MLSIRFCYAAQFRLEACLLGFHSRLVCVVRRSFQRPPEIITPPPSTSRVSHAQIIDLLLLFFIIFYHRGLFVTRWKDACTTHSNGKGFSFCFSRTLGFTLCSQPFLNSRPFLHKCKRASAFTRQTPRSMQPARQSAQRSCLLALSPSFPAPVL